MDTLERTCGVSQLFRSVFKDEDQNEYQLSLHKLGTSSVAPTIAFAGHDSASKLSMGTINQLLSFSETYPVPEGERENWHSKSFRNSLEVGLKFFLMPESFKKLIFHERAFMKEISRIHQVTPFSYMGVEQSPEGIPDYEELVGKAQRICSPDIWARMIPL